MKTKREKLEEQIAELLSRGDERVMTKAVADFVQETVAEMEAPWLDAQEGVFLQRLEKANTLRKTLTYFLTEHVEGHDPIAARNFAEQIIDLVKKALKP